MAVPEILDVKETPNRDSTMEEMGAQLVLEMHQHSLAVESDPGQFREGGWKSTCVLRAKERECPEKARPGLRCQLLRRPRKTGLHGQQREFKVKIGNLVRLGLKNKSPQTKAKRTKEGWATDKQFSLFLKSMRHDIQSPEVLPPPPGRRQGEQQFPVALNGWERHQKPVRDSSGEVAGNYSNPREDRPKSTGMQTGEKLVKQKVENQTSWEETQLSSNTKQDRRFWRGLWAEPWLTTNLSSSESEL